MDTLNEKHTDYDKVIRIGTSLMLDLMAQILNLIVILNQEIEATELKKTNVDEEENKSSKNGGSAITIRAYKTSIIMLMFDALESICNFLSELILAMNGGIDGSLQVEYNLNQIEIDLLKEQKTYIDCKTGKIKVSESNFIATMDKLIIVPFLLAKIYGLEFKIDKSGKGWQGILELKQLRDKLTHPKFNLNIGEVDDTFSLDINNIKPAVSISNMELFKGTESVRWYWGQIRKVFEVSGLIKQRGVFMLIAGIDLILWLMMMNLCKSCGIKNFDEKYQSPFGKIK